MFLGQAKAAGIIDDISNIEAEKLKNLKAAFEEGKGKYLKEVGEAGAKGKLQIDEYIAPSTGKNIKVAVNDKAAVPIDKVEIYARGKVQSVKSELDELQRLKQSNRKLFDSDPNNAKRLKQLKDRHHNYERSISMEKNLESVGLDNTLSNNQKITEHLLEVGKTVTPENRVWVKSILEGPKGKLKVESTWKILDDGKAYLTTLKFIPIK